MRRMDIGATFRRVWTPGLGSILPAEAEFLAKEIAERRPKLFVEIGIATGFSTGLIASFMDEFGPARLLSFDLNTQFYGDPTKEVGFLLPDIYKGKSVEVKLHPRRTALDLADYVSPASIDMAFIDAHHWHPWPTLDTIAILPFMRPGALLFHHDVTLYREQNEIRGIGPKYLFDQIPCDLRTLATEGKSKIFHLKTPETYRSLESNLADALLLPWTPGLKLSEEHIRRLKQIIGQFWSARLGEAFDTTLRRFGGAAPSVRSQAPLSTFAIEPVFPELKNLKEANQRFAEKITEFRVEVRGSPAKRTFLFNKYRSEF